MNNVLDVKGYRFFQASYDQDEHGTILSVNRDVAGRNITYTGYLLLLIGLILCLVGKNSRFMTLSRRLKEFTQTTIGGNDSCPPCRLDAGGSKRKNIPDARCRAEICGQPGTCRPLRRIAHQSPIADV